MIGERIGWTRSSSVLRAKVAALRPLYRGVDPADRTEYKAGEPIVVLGASSPALSAAPAETDSAAAAPTAPAAVPAAEKPAAEKPADAAPPRPQDKTPDK